MSARLSSHLCDLMLETERLRRRLGEEKYVHYLCEAIDLVLERYHLHPERCVEEVALLLRSEWNVDGVFCAQADGHIWCLGASGMEVDIHKLQAIQTLTQRVRHSKEPLVCDDAGALVGAEGDWLEKAVAVPLYLDAQHERALVCVVGVYRSKERRVERRGYHRYQPSLRSPEFDGEDRQLIIEARETLADRGSDSLCAIGPAVLRRCVDVAGFDNFLVTQRVRRDDLAVHLGRELASEILSDPDYHARLQPRMKILGHMFCDIVGFSAFAREHRDEPERVMCMLNRYLTAAHDVIAGFPDVLLDKYIGDCLVLLVGAFDDEDVDSVTESGERLSHYAEVGVAMGFGLIEAARDQDQQVSVGFHIGPSLLGFVGPERPSGDEPSRVDFTAISDHMNIAARLQGEADGSELVVSPEVFGYLDAPGKCWCIEEREVELKNIGRQKVYALRKR